MSVENNKNELQIIQNMKTHYTPLIKEGAVSLGSSIMAQSIFSQIDKNSNGVLSAEEVSQAMPLLEDYIAKSIEKDDFYANLYFGEQYTEGLKEVDPDSDKTAGEQIIDNNINYAIEKIREYAKNHPEDTGVQKYAQKLELIIASGGLTVGDIKNESVAGNAQKNPQTGKDTIYIDNHDIESNLNRQKLLQTLLHELRHTMETDDINSKVEELEAETASRELAKRIDSTPQYYDPISDFLSGYAGYAEASPGTYNIPENTGIALWYKPKDVILNKDDNKLVISSEPQESLNGATIEDHVQFGDEKDENGNPYPVSATRQVVDSGGNVIFTADYGEYDKDKKAFDYFKVKIEQSKFENKINPNKFLSPGMFGFS